MSLLGLRQVRSTCKRGREARKVTGEPVIPAARQGFKDGESALAAERLSHKQAARGPGEGSAGQGRCSCICFLTMREGLGRCVQTGHIWNSPACVRASREPTVRCATAWSGPARRGLRWGGQARRCGPTRRWRRLESHLFPSPLLPLLLKEKDV